MLQALHLGVKELQRAQVLVVALKKVPAGQGVHAPVAERVPRQTHLPDCNVKLVSHVVQAPVLLLHAVQ